MINQAIEFVMSTVIEPALDSSELDQNIKNKIANTRTVVSKYRKVGDLYKYLNRFQSSHGGGELVFNALEQCGLQTFESIYPTFRERFKYHLDDHTVLSDFVVGNIYNSFDIAFAAGQTGIQQGIYLVGKDTPYQAILIKATLDNGKYANEWIVDGRELKYYLKSINGVFKRTYKENTAIVESQDTPIFVFIKNGTECKLSGHFRFSEVIEENDGSMWFKLTKEKMLDRAVIRQSAFVNQLDLDTKQSIRTGSERRKARLKGASKRPGSITVVSTNYQRNPDVIAEVLERANGICEYCQSDAPFIRASDNTPYLEVHHKVRLADGGEDTVENAIAVCPNCHRFLHFGSGLDGLGIIK